MNENDPIKTLSDIKSLMERSSRFLSLSGQSGIFTGMYALAGALAAAGYARDHPVELASWLDLAPGAIPQSYPPFLTFFIVLAAGVLLLSLLTAALLSRRLAKKQGVQFWDAAATRLLGNLFLPLVAGGLFCLILLHYKLLGLIAPSMLIFYGLALLNASKYTYNDIRFLGIIEIVLGLAGALYSPYGLYFWAFGFGVMHIVYGITMYYKYER